MERTTPQTAGVPACERIREALSAGLDGEAAGVDAALVDDHLAICGSCRSWQASVARLHRRTRVSAAPEVPDLRARVVAAVSPLPTGRRDEARVVLGLAGLVQVAVAVVGLVGAEPLHAVREVAAFELALGVALMVAAWRPVRFARGMVPVVSLAAVVVLATAVFDIVDGVARPVGEFSHLVPAIGAGVLWWLSTHVRPWSRRPGVV